MTPEFNYMLLGRLISDIEYYLHYGNRCAKHLWAGNEQAQIDKMRELYNKLDPKPEWCTPAIIDLYAKDLGVN